MNIQEIYSKYKIMPSIYRHQFRVAAVAKLICDSLKKPVDSEGVVVACLLHDMGNIIKFDLKYFPEFTQPEGLEYWENVKAEYIKKYGPEEHQATELIARELAIPEKTFSYLHNVGFSKLSNTKAHGSLEDKICAYSDMRVGPHGVLSVDERLTDGRKRYAGRKHTIAGNDFEVLAQSLKDIEQEIFKDSKIKPGDITDESIREIIEEVKKVKI